jgi:hypothetical protein
MAEARRTRKLFFRDNLEILLRYSEDESVNLIPRDLAIKTNVDRKSLFPENDITRSGPQSRPFDFAQSAIWW